MYPFDLPITAAPVIIKQKPIIATTITSIKNIKNDHLAFLS